MRIITNKIFEKEPIRFAINGLVATLFHFFILSFILAIFQLTFAAVAGLVASLFGIMASFLGNRYFVFRAAKSGLTISQISKFVPLYLTMSFFHTGALFFLTDIGGIDYRASFFAATSLQVLVSYACNKQLVFRT